ncbi:MAG: aminoacetone oxidase family FAD-binding enzyme [Gallionellales bacterium CG_4_8_14_3_um_filter_54_18]|nr:MAG: aminoacetone oxidase family FAD-binding enzyme [Gallionellales bacterium CG_4_8_14_3_um_filter_54_18]PJC05799.1 MAG: aminoacetone oxidase family FAD-binding enzyme [Gallionellales bacterium CG_4_9_14_0_8_um_filter_55_61]
MKSDVIIIGSGAAGLMCALQAGLRGRSVVLLDHAKKLAEKIRISGGGRCNFTNLNTMPDNFISSNPHFCRSALARYSPQDFIALVKKHNLAYSEKTLGQLFCDDGSEAIITLLRDECDAAGVKRYMSCEIEEIKHTPYAADAGIGKKAKFYVSTSRGEFEAVSLVVATGGLSIPKTGATPFGYHVAEQFGIPITKLKAGLVPLTFAPDEWKPYADLTGVSFPAIVTTGKQSFRESLLVTHRGLSGPVILQASSYWQPGEALHINLLPDCDVETLLTEQKTSKKLLSNYLIQWFPKSFAEIWCEQNKSFENKPLNQYNDKQRKAIAVQLHDWQVIPSGTQGYTKAEVTCGGVDTHALSSKTMECLEVPGLYFIGEVVDVTGQLGGYNFQWAWASGFAAGQAV